MARVKLVVAGHSFPIRVYDPSVGVPTLADFAQDVHGRKWPLDVASVLVSIVRGGLIRHSRMSAARRIQVILRLLDRSKAYACLPWLPPASLRAVAVAVASSFPDSCRPALRKLFPRLGALATMSHTVFSARGHRLPKYAAQSTCLKIFERALVAISPCN
jgi:hypothetical protein